ncbi:hypothetical protein BJY01DRAFT_246307 [Aspergillus pseudoustus]|uniref:DUF7730 domain-containing protein n=1 Tax=Aspergillus pseudoustus TaxID=1810923 RepID=A0ABR4K8F9_9EURO
MARTKVEAYYSVLQRYIAEYKRTQAQDAKFAKTTLPDISTSSGSSSVRDTDTRIAVITQGSQPRAPRSGPRVTRSQTLYRTDPQAHCLLFNKLPPEIRYLIWVAVLGGFEIKIIPRRHRGVIPCVRDQCKCTNKRRRHTCPLLGCMINDLERKSNLLSLVLTSRRVYVLHFPNLISNPGNTLVTKKKNVRYAETLPLLYSRNTFSFACSEVIQLLRASIPPSHWNHIRSVHARDRNLLWADKSRPEVFKVSCKDALSSSGLRELTLRIRRSVGAQDFAGLIAAFPALQGSEERRGARLVLEVEEERDLEVAKGAIEDAGMGDRWKVRLVEVPEEKKKTLESNLSLIGATGDAGTMQ